MARADQDREFLFTREHFIKVRDELYDYAGIVLADHKMDMAYNRLVRRLRELKLDNFDDYLQLLERNPVEFGQFINALTTNLTAFFREKHHFDFVQSTILPEIQASGQRRLRGWSAGCSLGEETYSLAMSIRESQVNTESWDVRLLATDIDSKVLQSASNGVYDKERIKSLPAAQIKRWFLKGKGKNEGSVKIRQELQQLVTFRHLNLMEEWPHKGPLDFIFCRNVMIYFDQVTQEKLLDRMAALLKPNGYLFVGHSEALARHATSFELVGKTIYRKV
ncbi:CheR family methyltransferase [Neptuniibacter caesariensis]|uniref:Chemotaxis protein methyltransferase n=1 Tax=Neptuniibacter caesariensis TaxID=207954 RepID=A0A7U8C623_NEPCE|nr:CheR family methyltransferase [Neptuniibacter caesariensis]EAR60755.1 MCP methyltransferase, CheR-type [Neptuniibacter caesariensis]